MKGEASETSGLEEGCMVIHQGGHLNRGDVNFCDRCTPLQGWREALDLKGAVPHQGRALSQRSHNSSIVQPHAKCRKLTKSGQKGVPSIVQRHAECRKLT